MLVSKLQDATKEKQKLRKTKKTTKQNRKMTK